MTTLGQAGVFSFGQQSAKGTIAATWYRHKAMDINLGAAQDLRTFPLECGGGKLAGAEQRQAPCHRCPHVLHFGDGRAGRIGRDADLGRQGRDRGRHRRRH